MNLKLIFLYVILVLVFWIAPLLLSILEKDWTASILITIVCNLFLFLIFINLANNEKDS